MCIKPPFFYSSAGKPPSGPVDRPRGRNAGPSPADGVPVFFLSDSLPPSENQTFFCRKSLRSVPRPPILRPRSKRQSRFAFLTRTTAAPRSAIPAAIPVTLPQPPEVLPPEVPTTPTKRPVRRTCLHRKKTEQAPTKNPYRNRSNFPRRTSRTNRTNREASRKFPGR